MKRPNAASHAPDPVYIQWLLDATKLTQVEAAAALGVSRRTLCRWLATPCIGYAEQFCLECLALPADPV